MSLINDALQELESRHANSRNRHAHQAGQDYQEEMQEELREELREEQHGRYYRPNTSVVSSATGSATSAPYYFRYVPMLMVAGMCLAAGYWYAGGLNTQSETVPEQGTISGLSGIHVTPATAKSSTAITQAKQENTFLLSTEAGKSNLAKSTVEQDTLEGYSDGSEKSEEKALTEEYLKLAQQALVLNRLTLPEDKSALFFFQKILLAENADQQMQEQAKAGIEQLQKKYLAQLDWAIISKNVDKAASLFSRLDKIHLPERVLDTYTVRMDSLASQLQPTEQSSLASTAESKTQTIDQVRFESTGSVKTLTASHDKEPVTTKNPDGYFDLRLTLETRDAKIAREATALLSDGNKVVAINILQQFVKQNPSAFKSNILLVETLLEQGDYSRAQQVLTTLPADHAGFTYLNALLSNAVHGSEYAIALLERDQPGDKIEKKHLSLLAGLYQKQKQSEKAWLTYQLLVQKHPVDVRVLLGYAVSSDTLNKKQQALRAYSSLKAIGHPDPSVQKFVNERIHALKPDVVVEVSQW